MDKDEQELADIHLACHTSLAASEKEYNTKRSAALDLYFDQIQGASEEQTQIYRQQYRQKEEALLQECIERNHEIITAYMQQQNALYDRVRNTPTDLVYPYWRCRITSIAEEAPPDLQHFFERELDVHGKEGLHEFFRFFLNNQKETKQGSPIEIEIIRVTHEESVIYLKGREEEDRAVYHVDFRLSGQQDLIGHDHIQNEVIGAWVCVGGQFVHRIHDYTQEGRPIRTREHRHRPIPEEYSS
jgi:hypothetical protein